MGEYTRGIAFVLEGATEKVFYRAFLKWFAEQNNCSFVKGDNLDNGDIYFEWDNGAETMIESLNFQRIVDYSPLDLEKLSTALTKPQNIVDNNQRAT